MMHRADRVFGAANAMPPGAETIAGAGLHILPGAIDAHVHFRAMLEAFETVAPPVSATRCTPRPPPSWPAAN